MNDDLIKKAAGEYAFDTHAKRLETYPEAKSSVSFPEYDTDDLADAFEAGAKFALAKQNNDAEGNDTLTCGKGWAVKLYKIAYSAYAVGGNKWYQGYMKAMRDLFGTMWLDYADSSNVEILEKNGEVEPKPAEPKFKVGDKVKDISSPHDDDIYKVDDIQKSSDGFIYHIQGLIGQSNVKESDLEPYTEPTNEDFVTLGVESAEYLRKSLEESEYRNSSQNIANCDKHFDNILKDSFSKERRLNIAAMAMQGILCNKEIFNKALQVGEETLEGDDIAYRAVAKASFAFADALIAVEKRKEAGR